MQKEGRKEAERDEGKKGGDHPIFEQMCLDWKIGKRTFKEALLIHGKLSSAT